MKTAAILLFLVVRAEVGKDIYDSQVAYKAANEKLQAVTAYYNNVQASYDEAVEEMDEGTASEIASYLAEAASELDAAWDYKNDCDVLLAWQSYYYSVYLNMGPGDDRDQLGFALSGLSASIESGCQQVEAYAGGSDYSAGEAWSAYFLWYVSQ